MAAILLTMIGATFTLSAGIGVLFFGVSGWVILQAYVILSIILMGVTVAAVSVMAQDEPEKIDMQTS